MNQTLPAVSVIIPMFNAGKFIADGLESLLAQTLTNFEVIVVDDCSTDNSVAVVQSYTEKFDGRLKLTNLEENSGGCAIPRNKGFSFSRGEYIFFMDADDLITPTALEELYTLAQNFDVEVVYCERFYTINAALDELQIHSEQEGGSVAAPTLETENLARRVENILSCRYRVTSWLKFVRRDFMARHELFFPNIKPSEDSIWTYGLIFFARRFLLAPNAVYIYRQSENSIQRRTRSSAQEVNFWLNPVIAGVKTLNKFMSRLEFFRQNPNYRYAMLEHAVHLSLGDLFGASLQLPPAAIYEAIRDEYGKILGEHDVLISFLLADLIEQQKIFVKTQERIAKLEKIK